MGNKKGTTYINSILSFLTCGLLLLAFITGCSDNLLPSDDMKSFSNQQRSSKIYSGTYGGQLTKYSQDPVVQAAEEPFIELSKKIAGFAGYIDNTGVFNWDAVVDNEQGTVSYQWKIKWEGTSTWNTLGTASSQSVTVNNDTNFNLKVIVTDDIESATAFRTVTVNLGDCEPFEPCQD